MEEDARAEAKRIREKVDRIMEERQRLKEMRDKILGTPPSPPSVVKPPRWSSEHTSFFGSQPPPPEPLSYPEPEYIISGAENAWKVFKGLCVQYTPVGSRVVCNPPILHTDMDYLALVEDAKQAESLLMRAGFTVDSEQYNTTTSPFISYRRGKINVIVTSDPEFHGKFILASKLCRRFNLTDKQDRILLHHAIIDGTIP